MPPATSDEGADPPEPSESPARPGVTAAGQRNGSADHPSAGLLGLSLRLTALETIQTDTHTYTYINVHVQRH